MITDFGLALRQEAEAVMTIEGQTLGTPVYMSPEQHAGKSHEADARSDVWSLGVILYELLTGELPFRGHGAALSIQIQYDDPPPPRRVNDKLPRDLETIALKCLAKSPARRYATARALCDDHRRWLGGEPIQVRPVGQLEKLWLWSCRKPAMAAFTASLLGTVLTGFGGVTWQWWRAEQNAWTIRQQRDLAFETLVELASLTGELGNEPGMPALKRRILEAAVGLEPLLETDPATPSLKRAVAGVHSRLGVDYLWSGRLDEARTRLERQHALLEELLVADPKDDSLRENMADSLNKLGYVEKQAFDFPAAVEYFQRSAAIWRDLIASGRVETEIATWGLKINEAESEICRLAPQAIESLDFALSRLPRQAAPLLVIRAQFLASRGRIPEVIETAEKLEALDPQSGQNLFNVACCYSVCAGLVTRGRPAQELSTDETAACTRYKGLAIQFLDKAAQHGWNHPHHVAWLETDPDLAVIRDDAAFRELFNRLKYALLEKTNE